MEYYNIQKEADPARVKQRRSWLQKRVVGCWKSKAFSAVIGLSPSLVAAPQTEGSRYFPKPTEAARKGIAIAGVCASFLFVDGATSPAEAFRNSISSGSGAGNQLVDVRGPSLGQCGGTSGQYFGRSFGSSASTSQARIGIDNGGTSNVGRNFRFTRPEFNSTAPISDASGSSNGSVNYIVESDAAATSGCNITNLAVEESVTPLPGDAWNSATFIRTYSYTYQNRGYRYRLGFLAPNANYSAVREQTPLPTVTGPANYADATPFSVTINFDEAVTGFAQSDLSITGGTLSAFSGSGSGPYTVTVTPTGPGDVTLSVPEEVATSQRTVIGLSLDNVRSNTLTVSPANEAPTISFTEDIQAGPVLTDGFTITSDDTDVGDTLTRDFVFVDTAAQCTATTDFTGATSYSSGAPVSVTSANNGDFVCARINDGTETVVAVSTNDINIDDEGPVPSFPTTPPGYTPGQVYTTTLTFDQDINVSTLTASDLVVGMSGNGTVGSVSITRVADDEFTVSVTPSADATGNLSISLPTSSGTPVVTDPVGNGNPSAATLTIGDADDTPPQVTSITPSVTGYAPNEPFTVEVVFNEPVDGVTDASLTATPANVGTSTVVLTSAPTDPYSTGPYIFTVTPSPDAVGDITLDVPDGAAQDQADNDNDGSFVSLSNPSDLPPSPEITGPSTNDGETPFEVTITFSEPVTGFEDGDLVVVTGGTPSNVQPTSDPAVYTATITPDGSEEPIEISISAGVAVDSADQANTATAFMIAMIDVAAEVSEILSEDLERTVSMLSSNVSRLSRDAGSRLRHVDVRQCALDINALLQADPVRFANDSFVIDARNNALLDDIAEALNTCPDASFTIAGHTDSDASDAYNVTLSLNRVRAVKAALVERGIADDRLATRGFGESRPIATNATEEGQALNRRVEFIPFAVDDDTSGVCDSGGPLAGNVQASADGQTANVSGALNGEAYDCITGVRTETWGTLNVTQDDDYGTVGMASFGISREKQDGNALNGRFIEGYLTQNTVDSGDTEGTITGFGLHAGLYRAQGLDGGLVLSYYGSVAAGQHNYDLDVGVEVDGNYSYAGVFAGAALSGEQSIGDMLLRPTAGIDLAYAEVIGSEMSEPGTLDIEPANLARGFLELGLQQTTDTSLFIVTPRVFCESNRDSNAEACGFGVGFDYETTTDDAGVSWAVGLDYEKIDTQQRASLEIARVSTVFGGLGVSRSSLSAAETGAVQAEQTVSFSW